MFSNDNDVLTMCRTHDSNVQSFAEGLENYNAEFLGKEC